LNNANISREKTQYYSLTFLEVDKERTGLAEDGKSGIILEMIINKVVVSLTVDKDISHFKTAPTFYILHK